MSPSLVGDDGELGDADVHPVPALVRGLRDRVAGCMSAAWPAIEIHHLPCR
jgi:hypothetical protein